jgi:molecular chaperone Hsp33
VVADAHAPPNTPPPHTHTPQISLSANAEVSVLVADCTQLVAEAATRHRTSPTATAAFGRALISAAMLNAFRKDGERLSMTIRGDGPLGHIQVVANDGGYVKGLVSDPSADVPIRESDGKLDVSRLILGGVTGFGSLSITRILPWQETPYTGSIPLVSGEVSDDVANYLVESEQTNCAFGAGVLIGQGGVVAAGGFYIAPLPFASEETLARLEENVGRLGAPSKMLADGMTPAEIAARVLEGLGEAEGFPVHIEPRFGPCDPASLRDKMMTAIASLGEEDAKLLLEERGGNVEVRCEMCAEAVEFDEEEVLSTFSSSSSSGSDDEGGGPPAPTMSTR